MSRYRSEMSCKRFLVVPLTKGITVLLLFFGHSTNKICHFFLFEPLVILWYCTFCKGCEERSPYSSSLALWFTPTHTAHLSHFLSPCIYFLPLLWFWIPPACQEDWLCGQHRITHYNSLQLCVCERGGGGVLRGGLYFQGSYYNYMTKCCKSHRVLNTGAGVRGQSTFSGVICKCHSGGLLCQSLVSAAGFLMQISRIRAANAASFCWPPWQYYLALLVKSAKICDKKKHSLRSWKKILITVFQNVFLV